MSIVLQSSGGGSVTVQEPSTASNVTQTLQAATGTIALTNQLVGFRNRIINGAMTIDQRNAGASVTPTTSTYTLDRWNAQCNVASKYSVQQNAGSVTPPAGFRNYLGVTSLSAYSVGSGEFFMLTQNIEGFNTADLMWGTSNAQTVTLSFWVRSSLTGTFGGALNNSDNSRSYPFSYSISAANTWEQKSVTIAGDTSGTWNTTNGAGIVVRFGLGMGSTLSGTAGSWSGSGFFSATGATSVVGTNGATFYITGVQLEVGSTATSFDYRPYGTELILCQRYYAKTYDVQTAPATATQVGALCNFASSANGSGVSLITFQLPVNMRAIPTVAIYSPSLGTLNRWSSGSTDVFAASNTVFNGTKNVMSYTNAAVTLDVYCHMTASAEL